MSAITSPLGRWRIAGGWSSRGISECDGRPPAVVIVSEFAGATPYTLGIELEGFVRDRTVWDARRLANALCHVYGRDGLAREIEDAIDAD